MLSDSTGPRPAIRHPGGYSWFQSTTVRECVVAKLGKLGAIGYNFHMHAKGAS